MCGMALSSLLEEALEAWQYTRDGVIEEIENLSETDLKFRPHAESRTAAEIGLHIVESGLMMAGELTRSDGNFRRKSYPLLLKEHAGTLPSALKKAALVKLLKRTHAEGDKKIRRAGELFMLQRITRFDGEQGTRRGLDESRHLARGLPSRPNRAVRASRRPGARVDTADSKSVVSGRS